MTGLSVRGWSGKGTRVFQDLLFAASRSERTRKLSSSLPLLRRAASRFVAGDDIQDAVGVAADITATGRLAVVSHLGENVERLAEAEESRDAYLELLESLAANGLTGESEVSVKLSAIGQALPIDGEKIALDFAREITAQAAHYGTTVELDMEDHTTTDATLEVLRSLREDFPRTGGVLQASLYRTEADCQDLASEGSRIRICKGSYSEPESVAYQTRHETDLAFVRCVRLLMEGDGYPMIATHDSRIVEIAQSLAIRSDRPKASYEFQMLLGVRAGEQERLAGEGERTRVYIPYGPDWYEYMVRRVAERPATVGLFARSLTSKK
jgi:proline dehydrogenase